MKVQLVICEHQGIIDSVETFLSEDKARERYRELWAENGFTWNEKEQDFFDENGHERGAGDLRTFYSWHETDIEDLKIDSKLLDKQICALLESNIPESHKAGLHHLLGAILDASVNNAN